MTTPTNSENLSGYLGYVQDAFFSDALLPTQGAVQNYPISAFINALQLPGNVNYTLSNVAGAWTYNLYDLYGVSSPQLDINATENYLNSALFPINQAVSSFLIEFQTDPSYSGLLQQYGVEKVRTASGGTYLSLGTLPLSLSSLAALYQPNGDIASNPQADLFATLIGLIDNQDVTYGQAPTSLNAFMELLQNAPILEKNFIGQVTGQTIPGLTLSAVQPSFASSSFGSNSAVLNSLFSGYVQNYQTLVNQGLFKNYPNYQADIEGPSAFAAGWYLYLESVPPPPGASAIAINLVGTNPELYGGGAFNISTGMTNRTQGSSTPLNIIPSNPPVLSAYVNTLVNNLETDFSQQINYTQNYTGLNLPSGTSIDSLFYSNFQTFMNYILNQGGADSIGNYTTFLQEWDNFVGPVALLTPAGAPAGGSQSLLTYLNIYNVFYPPSDPQNANFLPHLASFINSFVGKTGSGLFNTTLMVDQWLTDCVNNVFASQVDIPSGITNWADVQNVSVLNILYNGLASMVEGVQQLTIAQATDLNFYSNNQEDYTDLIQKVPYIIRAPSLDTSGGVGNISNSPQIIDTGPLAASGQSASNMRADFNALTNQYVESLRSYRSNMQDMGNQFQAAFSVSNQAVNSEISIATQILQLVNTVANAIFAQQQQNFDGSSSY